MAKYAVKHSCGHERVVELYGKHTERNRKLDWLQTQICPKCWGEQQRAAEDQMPITIKVMTTGLPNKYGQPMAEIILLGNTRPKKDLIKSLGYSWREISGGILDMLTVTKPKMAWVRIDNLIDICDKNSPAYNELMADKTTLGADKIINGITLLDLEMARQSLERKPL